ncbi:MAG: recombinase family protein [Parcubacteria group bacterium]|nr:recombinase family protein [Parcubacteria group bacterium]
MFAVISALSEFERHIITDRVKAGLATARAKGKKLGRPPLPLDGHGGPGGGLGWNPRSCKAPQYWPALL